MRDTLLKRLRFSFCESHLFFVLVFLLAGAQILIFKQALPGPDSLAYFEVADQIQKIGYAKALSEHWSPLYSLYLSSVNRLFSVRVENELLATTWSFTVLILFAAFVGWFFIRFLSQCLWPVESKESFRARSAWQVYGLGLILFFLFVVFRVDLRLPDVLVFSFTVLSLWFWCRGFTKKLEWTEVLGAGVMSGLGFLARANILHWSLVTALLACLLVPKVCFRKRFSSFLFFLSVVSLFFFLQLGAFSIQKGHFAFGESGKTVFAGIYGAEWKEERGAWPVRLLGGDVRIFTESREVCFPGFYDVGREFENATIPYRWKAALRGFLGGVQSILFGYYSPTEALVWPILWALFPFLIFGVSRMAFMRFFRAGSLLGLGMMGMRERVAVFLILAGFVGLGMHLLTYAIGYYLPPYLFMVFMGLAVLTVESRRNDIFEKRWWSLKMVGVGFALVTVLYTFSLFRVQHRDTVRSAFVQTQELSVALERTPKVKGSFLRRIAVVGMGRWLGVYAIRLSKSQVYADLPNPDILKDAERFREITKLLLAHGVTVVLAPVNVSAGLEIEWKKVEGTPWCVLVLQKGY